MGKGRIEEEGWGRRGGTGIIKTGLSETISEKQRY